MEIFKNCLRNIINKLENEIEKTNKDLENLNKSISLSIAKDNVVILENRIKQLKRKKIALLRLEKVNKKIIKKFNIDNEEISPQKKQANSKICKIKCNSTDAKKNICETITIGDKIELSKGEICLTATNGYNYQLNNNTNIKKKYFIDLIAVVDYKGKKIIKMYSQKGLTDKKIREEMTDYYKFDETEFKLVYHLLNEDKSLKGWIKNVANKEISRGIVVPYKSSRAHKNYLQNIDFNR